MERSFLATMIIIAITTYRTAYDSLYQATGIAYGCANITTELLDKQDIIYLKNGNRIADIGEKINWTVEHKGIFKSHSILSLDVNILSLDNNKNVEAREKSVTETGKAL